MDEKLEKVDHSALRTNQAFIIALNILAFLFNAPWLATLVALMMVLGAVRKTPGFGFIYRYALKPIGWIKPDLIMDNPEPHRFAQGLGSVFMIGGSLALWVGMDTLGWGFIWLVAALAALNLLVGLCVGCMVYYWLARLNVPGFHKSPPLGTFPGMKPRTKVYES